MPVPDYPDEHAGEPMASVSRAEQFMQLLVRYEPRIYGFILAMVGGQADADDVMQETTTVMWRKFDEFKPGSDFSAWAMATANFQVMSFRKRRAIQRLRLSDRSIETIASHLSQRSDVPDERIAALRQCLAELTDRQRQLIELRYERGAKAQGIAEKVNLPVSAIYKALSRIHGALTRCVRAKLAGEI